MNNKSAILVIDMINDFVTGPLGCEGGRQIVGNIKRIVDKARRNNIPVFFCNDSHVAGEDVELKVWGEHAMRGTLGAQVIPELELSNNDYVIPKRTYSAFFHTELNGKLKELSIETLIVVGLQTHICVVHTAADAFYLEYDLVVAKDAVTSFEINQYEASLKQLKEFYNANLLTTDEVIERLK